MGAAGRPSSRLKFLFGQAFVVQVALQFQFEFQCQFPPEKGPGVQLQFQPGIIPAIIQFELQLQSRIKTNSSESPSRN